MSCGEKHSVWFCHNYNLLWRRQWKGPELVSCLASNGWKTTWQKFDFSEEEIKDILDKESLRLMRIGQICLVKREKNQSTQQALPSLMNEPNFKALVPEIATPRYLLYRSDRTKPNTIITCQKRRFRKNSHQHSAQQPTGKTFMLNWNSAQLFLELPSWPKKSVSCHW